MINQYISTNTETFKTTRMNKKLLTLSLFIFISLTAFGQTDKEYSKTLKKMFEVSGSGESFQTAIDQMFALYKQQYTEVDSEVWSGLEKEFSKTSLNDLTEMLVPVYSKYLSLEDLKELIKFYETKVGKKFAKSNPLILQESMQVGQEWGMKIGQDFAKKMKDKGY